MEFTFPIGPQHPSLEGQVKFNVTVQGEKVVDFDVDLGYSFRGIEKIAQRRTYLQDIYLFERICGICSHSHPLAFVHAAELIFGLEIPERATYIRTIISELERVHNHFLWLGLGGEVIGFDSLFMYAWRDREIVMELFEEITGNRCNYAINTIGGVRRDIPEKLYPKIMTSLEMLERRVVYYKDAILRNRSAVARLKETGILEPSDAKAFCTVGPTARGSGLKRDVRKDCPYDAYGNVDFDIIVVDECDNLSRAKVRILELIESIKIIRQCIKQMEPGKIRTQVEESREGEAIGRHEAPRGENIYYVKSNGSYYPERVKIRAPTYANIFALKSMIVGQTIADIPITVASIDPCVCCTDRITYINIKEGENDELSF
ncbi:MAG: hydrogenase large subunit [Candidatus Methanofastidiosia archaeon]